MFQSSGPTHRSDGIGTQVFYAEILGNSHHKPYLLNFYTDFCMRCADVEVIWKAMHTVRGSMLSHVITNSPFYLGLLGASGVNL